MRPRDEIAAKLSQKKNASNKLGKRFAYRVEIDWEKVKHYLKCGLNGNQIANTLGISSETLYDRCMVQMGMEFSRFKQIHNDRGISEILETQHEVAIKNKDRPMLMWLGKCRAGQVDMNLTQRTDNEKQINELLSAVLKFAAKD